MEPDPLICIKGREMLLARYKTQIASLFRRFPWLGVVGQRIWRLGQARYTVGVVGVIFDDRGRILLLHHVYRTRYPWGLPGGWIERHEDPAAGLRRELREETGLDILVGSPLLVELGLWPGHLDLAFLGELVGGDTRLSGEIIDHRWCWPSELPELYITQRRAVEQALRVREVVL